MDESKPQDTPQASDPPGFDQSDIDALLAQAGEAPPPADGTAADASGEFNQTDVDALLDTLGADPKAIDEPESAAVNAAVGVDTFRASSDASTTLQTAARQDAATSGVTDPQPFQLAALDLSPEVDLDAKRVSMLNDVNLRVKIELGRTRMYVEDVLKLGEGSVVELDKLAGDPVDVFVNERLIARGEVLVLNDSFCVRISEVLSHDPHRVSI